MFYQLLILFSLGLLLSLKPAFASTSLFSDARVRCIKSERQTLLKFKQGILDDYAILSSWGTGEDNKECCRWWGVKCSNRTGHVIVVDVHGDEQKLGGEVSLSLLLGLQHLRYLDLSYNNFTRIQMREAISSLRRLKHLNLTTAGFTGVVPHQLGSLTGLQTLDLSWNHFTIDNLVWLSHLRLLKQLDLSALYLNVTNWLQVIVDLPFLEKLRLTHCKLGHTTPSSLLLPNSSSKSLSILDLSHNGLTSFSTCNWLFSISNNLVSIDLSLNDLEGSIPDAFGEMISLKDIDMGHNHLTGVIPKSFQNLSHLRSLILDYNNLSEPFPELLHKLSRDVENSLEKLILTDNQFYGPLTGIARFSSLRELLLGHNKFNGSLMKSFLLPPNLEVLDLSSNQITGNLLIRSLDGFRQHTNLSVSLSLSKLYLQNNKFTGRIPQSIGQLFKLEILDLSSNYFEGTVSEVHFSKLSNLKDLDLSFNSLTLNISLEWVPTFQLNLIKLANCSMGPHFPQWLKTQSSFSELDLTSNGILGIVPNWLWDLNPKLKYLNMSDNQINGTLPKLSQKFDNYPIIDLSSNNFSGPILSIPQKLASLHLQKNMFVGSISFLCAITGKHFRSLDLSNNLFSGNLSNCWMNMKELVVLNLGNNNFSGQIPASLSFLPEVQTLHLCNNSFVGEFPSSIKNCRKLKVIDVGGNKLTGNVLSWIGTSLTNLVFLSLPSNNFYGNIPPDVCHLSNIRVLDLSCNNFTGNIPNCFNNFTSLVQKNSSSSSTAFTFNSYDVDFAGSKPGGYYMDNMWVRWKRQELEYRKILGQLKVIDLSSNKLVGQIPPEIASLRGLISLNLSVNHLTGKIISNIDQMEMLESLDLSRNQLSGEIPTGLARLNFLSVLDLSNNDLSGRIPSGTQLQTFNTSTYTGNNLCGPPLEKCPGDIIEPRTADGGKDDSVENKDGFMTKEFYTSMGLGFLAGLCGVVALLFKDSWRNAYSRFLKCICDWIYVTSMVYWATLRRTLRG